MNPLSVKLSGFFRVVAQTNLDPTCSGDRRASIPPF